MFGFCLKIYRRIFAHLKSLQIFLWVLILIVILLLTSLLVFRQRLVVKNQNKAILSSEQNKFKLDFIVSNRDRDKFLHILEDLNLPQSVSRGVEFELDATSVAKLAFLTPIEADLEFGSRKIAFGGRIEIPQKQFALAKVGMPESTTLAVFAKDLRGFIKKSFKIPKELDSWFGDNLSSAGQYLIVFGEDGDFAVIAKAAGFNAGGLQDIEDVESGESIYKQESKEQTTFHLLKLEAQNEKTIKTSALFEKDGYIYFVSSYNAVEELFKNQDQNFPWMESEAVLAIFFRSLENSPLPQDFWDMVFSGNHQDFRLDKIEKMTFILKDRQFSGLIDIK